MRLWKSFQCAFRGIFVCIRRERNMRIHITVLFYVFIFSLFFELSRVEYAVLFLTSALVISTELLNTCAEEMADLVKPQYHPMIRNVKDFAAGAVLVAAIFAVEIGFCLFWKPEVFYRIFLFFSQNPWLIILFLISLVGALFFVKGSTKQGKFQK